MPFSLDSEVAATLAQIMGGRPPEPPAIGDVATRRERAGALFKMLDGMTPPVTDVDTQDFHTTADDGHEILCRWFTKRGAAPAAQPGPAILYCHGGGMIMLQLQHYDQIVKRLVTASGVPTLAVEYRLAPEVRAPVPVTDAYAALAYLAARAPALGVDPARIGVMGDSAGGGIAAALAHYAAGRPDAPRLARQILVYPMLDDRRTAPDPRLEPFAIWSAADNETGWGALLGPRRGGADVRAFEAPARMTAAEAERLPPAYIDVGELDIFCDEDLEYARALGRAGVSCEFHLFPHMPHAFDALAPRSEATRAAMAARLRVIASL